MGNCHATETPTITATPGQSTPEEAALPPQVVAAFKAQQAYFATGVTKDLEWRKQQLQLLTTCIIEAAAQLSEAQEADGVSPSDFMGASRMVGGAAGYYTALLGKWAAPQVIGDTCSQGMPAHNGIEADWVRIKEPLGVVLNIAPWNAPTILAILPAMGALAAGNCCVIKPSEVTTATSKLIRELIAAKMDPRVVTVVEGDGPFTSSLIDLGFDHIMFTGGPSIAKIVMARAAKTLTPVTLELGGKNPCLLDEMSDELLSAAIAEIIGTKAAFSGQFCQCHDVILVVDSMWDRALAKFEGGLKGLEAAGRRMVRCIHERQFNRVKRMLDETKGTPMPAVPEIDPETLLLPVTAIVEPHADDLVMQDEVFGPLWCIKRVANLEDAIAYANNIPTGKPLVSYYYGASMEHADEWQARTSSGSLAVNCGPMRLQSNFEAAIQGVGNSGLGGASLWGEHVFNTFSHTKHCCRPKGGAFAGSIWSPGGTYKPE